MQWRSHFGDMVGLTQDDCDTSPNYESHANHQNPKFNWVDQFGNQLMQLL